MNTLKYIIVLVLETAPQKLDYNLLIKFNVFIMHHHHKNKKTKLLL